jgi:Protein of unknown function (DUF3300)
MKTMNATLSAALVVLLSLTFTTTAHADAPANVQGNWTIYATNDRDGSTEIKHVQIAQYGNQLTGYFEGTHQSGPIQGEINGNHIRFDTVTRTVLHFRGEVFGDSMSGLCGVKGRHAPWQATRPATVPTSAPPTSGAVYQTQPIVVPPGAQATPEPVTYQAPSYSSNAHYDAQQNSASSQQYSMPAQQYSAPKQPPTSYAMQTSAAPAQQSAPAPAPAPLSADQLDSLVAPIALYPDALVAQVLAAATNPEQISYADDWLAQNRNLTGDVLAQAVNEQSWDPSVKALTQFPSVLDNLAHNLSWTSSLGQAFANQQADVMAAVQTMRARAQAAGTLQSNSQITVSTPASNTIVIQPANPQVVYVPQYNPTAVYGAPVVVPYYVAPPVPVASFGLYFGTGITIGATFGGGGWAGGFGWGWHAWGVNWGCCGGGGNTTIVYNHNTYINNHTWNNNNYNGYHPWGGGGYHQYAGGATGSQNHAWYGKNGTFHPDGNYKPGEDTHYGPNGAYHPNGYFGPNGGWHQDKPGTGPANMPNGGNNGNHGLIGGNAGVEHDSNNRGGQMLSQNRADNNHFDRADQNRSRFSGDGRANRTESERGRSSMSGHRSEPHMAREHAPAEHRGGGGGHRR